jgi:PleD family two-component response regulator
MKSTKDVGTVLTLYIPWLLCSDPVNSYLTLKPLPTPPGETRPLYPQQAISPPMSAALSPKDTQSQKPMEGFFDYAVQGSGHSRTSRVNPTTPLNTTSPLYSNETPKYSPVLERRPSMVIAIADDNNINLQILKRRLERMGHKVLSSRDGSECVENFKEHKESTQFVLMDIDMPLGLFLHLPIFTLSSIC